MHLDVNVVAIVSLAVLATVIDWLVGVVVGSKLYGFRWGYLDNHLRTTVLKLGAVVFLAFLQVTGQNVAGNFAFMQLSAWLGISAGVTFSAYGLAFIVSTISDIRDKLSLSALPPAQNVVPPIASDAIASPPP